MRSLEDSLPAAPIEAAGGTLRAVDSKRLLRLAGALVAWWLVAPLGVAAGAEARPEFWLRLWDPLRRLCEDCPSVPLRPGEAHDGSFELGDCDLDLGRVDFYEVDVTGFGELELVLDAGDRVVEILAFSEDCTYLEESSSCDGSETVQCLRLQATPGVWRFAAFVRDAGRTGPYTISLDWTPTPAPDPGCEPPTLGCGEQRDLVLSAPGCVDGWDLLRLVVERDGPVVITRTGPGPRHHLLDECYRVVATHPFAELVLARGSYHLASPQPHGTGSETNGLAVLGTELFVQGDGAVTWVYDLEERRGVRSIITGLGGLAAMHSPDALLTGAVLFDQVLIGELDPETGVWRESVVSVTTPDLWLSGLGVADGEILVADRAQPRLLVFSRSGEPRRTIELPYALDAIGADDSGPRVFALPLDDSGSIVELDPSNGRELARLPAPEPPTSSNGLAFDGRHLYYASGLGTRAFWTIDPDTGAATPTRSVVTPENTYRLDCPDWSPCVDCTVGELSSGARVSSTLDSSACRLEDGRAAHRWRFELLEPSDLIASLSSTSSGLELSLSDVHCRTIARGERTARGDTEWRLVARGGRVLDSGVYWLTVAGDVGEEDAPYELSFSTTPWHWITSCDVGTIRCGEEIEGVLEIGVDCQAAVSYAFEVWRFEVDETRRVDYELRSPDALLELEIYDESLVRRRTAELPPGRYYAVIRSGASDIPARYTFRLVCPVERLCQDCLAGFGYECSPIDVGDFFGETGFLPQSACESTAIGAVNAYELRVESTTRVRIDVLSRAFEPLVVLRDFECREVARGEPCDLPNAPDSSCLDQTVEPGTYWINVLSTTTGGAGDYVLRVDAPCPGGLQRPGDCDQNGELDLADAICLLSHLFLGDGRALPCDDDSSTPGNVALLDLDLNGRLEISDAVRLLGFLFLGGPPHPLCDVLDPLCARCVRIEGCPPLCGD